MRSPGSMRGPKNHHSSPPNSMWVPGIVPWIAGPAPWLSLVQTHEGLRRDEAAEAALRRAGLVEVQRVRVLHALDPAADVVGGDGILELAAAEGNADPAVDVGGVEVGEAASDLFGVHAGSSGGLI